MRQTRRDLRKTTDHNLKTDSRVVAVICMDVHRRISGQEIRLWPQAISCHLLVLLEECVGFDGVRFHFIIILELDRGGYKYFGVS